ncbi:GOLPH3/VPS74 family protein [Actinoplanes aureus]|uniref:GPP34 family phosphoprotein n=1 Tax=Actinoplanes aureus TaxID=2792083 RepID=A0A931G3E8_9ACTN|nr:GPP34 family phosphoprotein [Actinoplanes aureus]MBG0569175.1 GPP34 family phosphoprotein [Actinoplanes aureus]
MRGTVMPSAVSTRLTDDFWLAANDGTKRKEQVIADWPLGVGTAAGLLGELIYAGYLELRDGELFRCGETMSDDPALHTVLATMAEEEQRWYSAAPGQAWQQNDQAWPPQAESHHRRRGHALGTWLSYLTYERRAEKLVVDRLSRTGLVQLQEQRRWLGRPTVRYVPYNSVASGSRASAITTAVRHEHPLSRRQLFLARLFFATGLHQHALATLTPRERSRLADRIAEGLDPMSQELLMAADATVGEAAMR